jgi:hypothetical protein
MDKRKKFWNLYKSSDTLYNIWKKELICQFSLNIFQKLEYEKFLPRTSRNKQKFTLESK